VDATTGNWNKLLNNKVALITGADMYSVLLVSTVLLFTSREHHIPYPPTHSNTHIHIGS
jgi:hypothetical protein